MKNHFGSDSGRSTLARISKGLMQFQDLVKQLHTSHGNDILEGSFGHQELVAHPHRHLLEPAWGISTMQIEAAGDHISASARMLAPADGVITTYATMSCIRSMLEPCAAALWLLDPDIGPRERTRRVFAARFADMQQVLKIARAAGDTEREQAAGLARIEDVARSAIEYGFDPCVDRAGKTVAIGMRFPTSTQLIESQLNLGFWYRYLSAVSHGKAWALRESSMRQTSADYFETTGAAQAKSFEKIVPVNLLVTVNILALIAVAKAVRSKFNYGGWDLSELELGFEDVSDVLCVPESDRFWKSG